MPILVRSNIYNFAHRPEPNVKEGEFPFRDYLERINRITGNFFACGEGSFGRRPRDPDDPVDPVQFFHLK
jgi:hypothetical protein